MTFNDLVNCRIHCPVAVECPALSLANGNVTVTGINPGDNATYSCDDGYTLVGSSTQECLVTGEWSGAVPECFRESVYTL